MSSRSTDTHVVAPASSANIPPGLVTGDGVIGHTDWRGVVVLFQIEL